MPEDKVDLVVLWEPIETLTVSGDFGWKSEKIISLFGTRWEEDAAATIDLAVKYRLFDWLDLFARAENLLDKDYTESGYQMAGQTFYGGCKFSF